MISKTEYVKLNGKSRIISFILTFFFGPLGLIYSSWKAALAILLGMFLVATVFGEVLLLFVAFLMWLLSIGVGDHCAEKVNMKAAAEYRLRTGN
jgi:hypothetical protein